MRKSSRAKSKKKGTGLTDAEPDEMEEGRAGIEDGASLVPAFRFSDGFF